MASGTIKSGLKELSFDTNISAYSGFTIVSGSMYEQDGVVTIELYGNSSTAIKEGFIATISTPSYRPSDYRVVGVCMGRVSSWDVGVAHPATAWVFPTGNIYIVCDTACKGFILRVQYRPI